MTEPLRPGDPETIGRYRLAGRLGAGGMGEVFFGYSPGGRAVAVKVVRAELGSDEQFRRRFAREAEAARRVGGFHTAQVVDLDLTADPPWLVTAYVPGPSLATVVAEHGALPERSLRVLGAGLAEALEAIHAAGLVHRDLKPSNIILAADGPRVIDFGIAQALEGTALTIPGGSIGTPGFMAPEHVRGTGATPASDVFALGAVLCHAAGVQPFGEGPPHTLMYRIVHDEPDLRGVPAGIRDLAAACLAKDPAARPTPTAIVNLLGAAQGPIDEWLPAPVTRMVDRHKGATPPSATPPSRPPAAPSSPSSVPPSVPSPPAPSSPPAPWTPSPSDASASWTSSPPAPPSSALPPPDPAHWSAAHPGALPPAPISTPMPVSPTDGMAPRNPRRRTWPLLAGLGAVALAATITVGVLIARGKSSPEPPAPSPSTSTAADVAHCDREGKQVTDPQGRSFDTWTCATERKGPLYAQRTPGPETGYIRSDSNWFVCQQQGAPNPGGQGTTWLYTQGDDRYTNDGWGWYPATYVSPTWTKSPIPDIPTCPF
ncbi:serine/threonine-protein kinase [Actinomadura fibrosa]|uniref:Serine/threonine-protein kinase n=1 Tax=Actinomadura fibrosa TaxID=111802 RepID=A0ABW2XH03_9ACTN|nr:serine/threonine-protein kinase [Actinomadura fibrosa]